MLPCFVGTHPLVEGSLGLGCSACIGITGILPKVLFETFLVDSRNRAICLFGTYTFFMRPLKGMLFYIVSLFKESQGEF